MNSYGEDSTQSGKKVKVAVVDDHAMVAEGLGRIIDNEEDFELVGLAASVTEALLLIAHETPNVVLMDYRLPDGDGAEATEQILKQWPNIKVVMLSGADEHELFARAIEVGCSGFLAKNRPARDVVSAVRAASRGESIVRADELAQLLGWLGREPAAQAHDLTARELKVLQLLAQAKSTSAIATELIVSINTVRNHVSNILLKLGAHSKLEAVAIATRDGIVSFDGVT